MSDEIKVGLGLPWFSIAIGIISGWIATGTTEGLIIGGAMGIVVAVASYLGWIPFVGWWVYSVIINILFDSIGFNMPILFWWGMIFAIIYCIIISVLVSIGVLAILSEVVGN